MDTIPPTNPTLIAVMEELIEREPIFHRLEIGKRSNLENMTDDEYWEVGESGKYTIENT